MKQILTTIVLLSLIATSAQGVPVAIQRTGNFTLGDDPTGTWTIMLLFDDSAISAADDTPFQLTNDEVDNYMITTTDGNPATPNGTSYDNTDTILLDNWSLDFINADPSTVDLDQSTYLIIDSSTQNTFDYNPFQLQLAKEGTNDAPPFRERVGRAENIELTDDAGWWTVKQINNPAIPEPVTATLLLAGTLAMTRRRRVA